MNTSQTVFVNGTFPSNLANGTFPSDNDVQFFSAKKIAMLVGLSVIVLITIVGNFIVLLSFLLEPKLRQPFNYYIFNLAVTDFLVAITAMTFYTLDTTLGYWPFGQVMCAFWIYLDYAMTFASVFTLVAISVDRFWSVTWILHYRQQNTPRRALIIIFIVWMAVFIIWTPPFIGDRLDHNYPEDKCIWEPSENQEFIIVVDVIGHYLPCLLMVICYIKVYYVMRKQVLNKITPLSANQSSIAVVSGASGAGVSNSKRNSLTSNANLTEENVPNRSKFRPENSNSRHPASNQRERKIFVTLTYVIVSYLICWFPFYVTWDIYAWHPEYVPDWLYTFLFWMTYINSTLNPLLYGYTNKDFRVSFKKLLYCKYKN